jgi:hypothetical protein
MKIITALCLPALFATSPAWAIAPQGMPAPASGGGSSLVDPDARAEHVADQLQGNALHDRAAPTNPAAILHLDGGQRGAPSGAFPR